MATHPPTLTTHTPAPHLSLDIQRRFNARVLDPHTALHTQDDSPTAPTAYVADSLIIHGTTDQHSTETLRTLRVAAQEAQVALRVADYGPKIRDRVADVSLKAAAIIDRHWPTRVHLRRAAETPMPPADAWELLQHTRQLKATKNLSLEHMVHAVAAPAALAAQPNTFTFSHGQTQHTGHPLKMPVDVVLEDPAQHAPKVARPPQVAFLDTSIGSHDWFSDPETVRRNVAFLDYTLGIYGRFGSPAPPMIDLTGPATPVMGHGTFVAGLIRQTCPQAGLTCVPIFDEDGVVNEHVVLTSLVLLLARHVMALEAGNFAETIDVLVVSWGYYHEQFTDRAESSPLAQILQEMSACGITVVAAAGNDSTTAPLMPAALGHGISQHGGAPCISVGSLNPGSAAVSLFSNAGEWVMAYRPGANLVSAIDRTEPTGEWSTAFAQTAGTFRSGIDPQDFSSGFALWSGTSFAAPVLAGQMAAYLVTAGTENLDIAALVKSARGAADYCLSQ